MTMSLFKDDFYSTRPKRSKFGDKRGSRFSGGMRPSPMLRVAIISSLTSSVLAVVLFAMLSGGKDEPPASKPAAVTGTQALVETSERIISASEKVRPAVVSIINMTNQAMEMQDEEDADWEDEEYIPEYASLGSGVIFKKEDGLAYIITNAHVIQDAAEVQAVLVGGERKAAKIIGQDVITDLAVLSVDAKGIDTVVEIGASDKLRVGEMVIAIGNPLGFGDSLTQGIVSSTHRVIPVSLNQDGNYDWEQEVIQTDAAINQGNSGGALVDLNGKLVGINSMKVADYGVEGIGFAIPIDDAMPILGTLLEDGKIARPYIGVYSMDLSIYLDNPREQSEDEEDGELEESDPFGGAGVNVPKDVKNGIVVLEAVGPAKEAGLKLGDVVVALDDQPIKSTIDLRKYLYKSKKIGESLTVTYYRDGERSTLTVTLAEKEDDEE